MRPTLAPIVIGKGGARGLMERLEPLAKNYRVTPSILA